MATGFIWGAALLCAVWFAVHLFVGGKQVARPLLDDTHLTALVRETQYLCWHFTSVAIAAMSGFFFAALAMDEPAFAMAGTALAAGFSVVGVALVLRLEGGYRQLPQGWLFAPVTLLGLLGLTL